MEQWRLTQNQPLLEVRAGLSFTYSPAIERILPNHPWRKSTVSHLQLSLLVPHSHTMQRFVRFFDRFLLVIVYRLNVIVFVFFHC